MAIADNIRRCLIECDVVGIRRLWHVFAVGAPQPASDTEALASIHLARTKAELLPLSARAYSHAWLIDRGLPSLLPDELRPRGQQIHPVIVKAVGISLNARSALLKPALPQIRSAMENAVLEAHADGRLGDDDLVRARMKEARERKTRELFR